MRSSSVRVGRLRQVVPESLEFCFGMVARGTVCEGARLELEVVPAGLRCGPAAHEWELAGAAVPLPRAAAAATSRPSAGEEFLVESIESIEEDACIART